MDAAEHDLDAKLYKASSTLLQELGHKLPLLIFNPRTTRRLRVLDSKCEELRLLVSLLDRFQEWPQLLDPGLSTHVQLLSEAFVDYMTRSGHHYSQSYRHGTATVSPLPRAICRLLYSFCKIRGQKVIVRLLNNEPKFLAPMLSSFKAWNTSSMGMVWEERYIMMLWLSHLMLAPFELANMAVSNENPPDLRLSQALGDLPGFAGDITSVAFSQLESPGKEREAASILLVRLCLRKDMQAHDLQLKLVHYATQRLLSDTDLVVLSHYRALGLLSLLYGITNSGSDKEVAPYLVQIFQAVLKLATDPGEHYQAIRDSAPARKLILKILRVILTHAISLNSSKVVIPEAHLNMMLEESIQYFLDTLSDKETPVRMSAAKALSVVALRLDAAMSAEVVEAVLSCLQENVLLEDLHSHNLIPITDKIGSEAGGMKKNISAVDPMRWHGLMLTLAHLLFRRSPPPGLLPEIIQALILGLEFEQRSNVGTSVGVGVRDAACFGLWALARKYSTLELARVRVSDFVEAKAPEFAGCQSVLQLIAVKMVISGCLDPSGNIRRASSAALQELIGRHPDTILHGIALVQTVDYHAVARLSRAMVEVSPQAAAVDAMYHRTLLSALLDWRGARATDVNQRRWAASTIRILADTLSTSETLSVANIVLCQVLDLKPWNIGSTAGSRHGLLLALASTVESLTQQDPLAAASWMLEDGNQLLQLDKLTGKMDIRVTADLELVMEAISTLIGSICKCFSASTSDGAGKQQAWMPSALMLLDHCTVAGGRDIVVEASADANVELFKLLSLRSDIAMVENWLDPNEQSPSTFTSKGRIKSLSLIYAYLAQRDRESDLQQRIISCIIGLINGSYRIETRVDAMRALGVILRDMEEASGSVQVDAGSITNVLCRGLTDYTNDQRGDIGSLLRLQSLEAVNALRSNEAALRILDGTSEAVMPVLVKLAAEKLDSVRFRAWRCLESYWRSQATMPELKNTFPYPEDVSTIPYFQQLMELLSLDWSRKPLIMGLVSSATSGTESICRAASNAFAWYLQALDHGKRDMLSAATSSFILEQLATGAALDDRQVVPLLDFLCFMMDQGLVSFQPITEPEDNAQDIWTIMQTIHGPSSSLQRTEASLNIYSRLLAADSFRSKALDKLTRQLLHRWPKVRNTAADLLYLNSPSPTLALCNWNGPVKNNRPVVLELRKELGVAGMAVAKT
ncbi:hypothetical protein A1O3_04850 [Capronia epimyces CBS 606.96]|uniref:Uncharacterized protein n=1 Tax=Capronia epimyces CBS 606.96 TaxID=1182542 RepID=W9XVC0_9EURO|nr:uncharacterized protein A1O3_04850 [Capronia epimyces CBS 606.96]EXJ84183.1 hypothetical protein A1O3_04850 [Capronia epimyces CBS 606.96]